MPRRGGGRPAPRPASPLSSRSYSSVPARPPPPAPPAAAPPMSPAMQQPKQPGLFAQMATTAAGVAVGSAVGHTIGHAMTGGGGGAQTVEAAPAPQQYPQAPYPTQEPPQGGICAMELKQFIECSQTQHDISLCQGFNEALRQCRVQNGVTM